MGDLVDSVGAIVAQVDDDRHVGGGTCFAVGDGRHFLTADHVIHTMFERGMEEGLSVFAVAYGPVYVPVDFVARHPWADVAIVRAATEMALPPFPLAGSCPGEPVDRLGFRKDGLEVSPGEIGPEIRVRVGYSTPRSDGAVRDVPARRYELDPLDTGQEVGQGFSGGPVVAMDGTAVGVHVLGGNVLDPGAAGRAWAQRVDTITDWIQAVFHQSRRRSA